MAWLGWSLARCGFEGRRRSRGGKQHGCFQLDLQDHESVLEKNFTSLKSFHNGIRPAIDRAFLPSFSHTQRSKLRRCVSGRRRGTASTVPPRPIHTHQVQHHLQTLHNQATTTTTTHRTHALYILTGESRPLRSRLSTRGGDSSIERRGNTRGAIC